MKENGYIWKRYYEQGLFVYLCLFSWATYFIVTPYVWRMGKLPGLMFIIFPGLFISIWLIYFQHECWHNYFKIRHNRLLFIILCIIVFVQPHLYDLGHRTHHANVNTYDDLEFYPIGKIKNKKFKIFCNCMSILFGSLFLLSLGGAQATGLSRSGTIFRFLGYYGASILIWGGVGYASASIFNVSLTDIFISYSLTIWLVSFVHHHNELIEHGNLIVEGDFKFRSSQTRNLSSSGVFAKLFLFFVHQDSREHTLHHTDPSTYSRPFTGMYPMPENAVHITFAQYFNILKSMILGEECIIYSKNKFD